MNKKTFWRIFRLLSLGIIFALALMNEGRAAEPAVSPSSFQSLQPFEHFAKGVGEGGAYRYEPRTKAQFVALLRDKGLAKKEMRVSCDILVHQMTEGHKGLPFEGCEGTAAAIENNDDFSAVACRDEMFQRDNWLTVTNEKGSAFGLWHRKCLKNEQVLVYKNQPLISLTCLNVVIPVTLSATVLLSQFAPPTKAILACPDIYTLKVTVWEHKAMDLPGVRETHKKEELAKKERNERFAGAVHVSKKHGKQFRNARAEGNLNYSTTKHDFRVSLVMSPEAESRDGESVITSEEVLGDISVTGLLKLEFTLQQLEQWDAIRLIPVEKKGISSPPQSNITGLQEMRFFNHLPGKKLGEWDNNPVQDCIMSEHWIEE